MFSRSLRAAHLRPKSTLYLLLRHERAPPTVLALRRLSKAAPAFHPAENMNVGHARFLAEGSPHARWNEQDGVSEDGEVNGETEEQDSVADGKGTQPPF